MPVSEYYKGSGRKVMRSMKKSYGPETGKRVFYATANKMGMKPSGDEMPTSKFGWNEGDIVIEQPEEPQPIGAEDIGPIKPHKHVYSHELTWNKYKCLYCPKTITPDQLAHLARIRGTSKLLAAKRKEERSQDERNDMLPQPIPTKGKDAPKSIPVKAKPKPTPAALPRPIAKDPLKDLWKGLGQLGIRRPAGDNSLCDRMHAALDRIIDCMDSNRTDDLSEEAIRAGLAAQKKFKPATPGQAATHHKYLSNFYDQLGEEKKAERHAALSAAHGRKQVK